MRYHKNDTTGFNIFLANKLVRAGSLVKGALSLKLTSAVGRYYCNPKVEKFHMFTLVEIQDTIRLPPETFHLKHEKALAQEINSKYSNKIIPNVGLAICLFDVQSTSDGLIKCGDGAIFIKTEFRLILFSPFDGEVLVGWISSCSPEGIKVRMEFFDDIFIPKNMLFEGCHFFVQEQAWIWKQDDDTELYLDMNEKIRFRVEQKVFEKGEFKLVGSCQTDGMGLISWW